MADGFAPIGRSRTWSCPSCQRTGRSGSALGRRLDLLLALVVTSLVRARRLRPWRIIHLLAYAAWPRCARACVRHWKRRAGSAGSRCFGFGCVAAVGLAVVCSICSAATVPPEFRVGCGRRTVAVALTVFLWYRGGPATAGLGGTGRDAVLRSFGRHRGASERRCRWAPARTTSQHTVRRLPRRVGSPSPGTRAGTSESRSPATCGARTSWGILHLTLWGTATGEGVAMSTSRVIVLAGRREAVRRNGRWAGTGIRSSPTSTDPIRRLAPALRSSSESTPRVSTVDCSVHGGTS